MYKTLILGVIVVIGILRWLIARQKGNNSNFLLISLFVQSISFGFGKTLYTYLSYIDVDTEAFDRLGAFGNAYKLESFFVFLPLFLAMGNFEKKKTVVGAEKSSHKWLYIFIGMCLISLVNPINPFPPSLFVLLFSLAQLLAIMYFIDAKFTRLEILRGIYDGLLVITVLQTLITICYPLLRIQAVTTWFKGDAALEFSLRREGYVSAIGIFGHPGPLALYCLMSALFFFSCVINNMKRQLSMILLGANLFIILFTFSRTTYITSVATMLLVYYIPKQSKSVFSLKNILILLLGFVFFLFILYLTPLSEVFLESDSSTQFENRFAHWYLGYLVWLESPLIGAGINSHVYFMAHDIVINADLPIIDFLLSNPIHNIHMIVLAETGLLGIFLWLYFFISKINNHSRSCRSINGIENVFNLTCTGVLSAFFVYGSFGWSPFNKEILFTCIVLCFFAKPFIKKKPKMAK